MASLPFHELDVFAGAPFGGNALAVIHDADDLRDDTMRAVARWTNVAETTFLLPPTDPAADYRVRIFTPSRELPFAGHPTLGSCRAWLTAGGVPDQVDVVTQECGAGLVRIRRQGDALAFAAPGFERFGAVDGEDLARARTALGLSADEVLDASWIDTGSGWLGLRLATAARVLAIESDWSRMRGQKVGVIGPHRPGGEVDVEVRAFTPDHEDPVTGSLNAGFGVWLTGNGVLPTSYTAAQGTVMGYAGRVSVSAEGDPQTGDVWIGGRADVRIAGTIDVPA